MTTTIEFKANDEPGAKEAVAELNAALGKVIAGGFVDHLMINGKPEIASAALTPEGASSFHPADHKQDKHTPHPPGNRHGGSYHYTLVPKP